jgi:hypothetical protein
MPDLGTATVDRPILHAPALTHRQIDATPPASLVIDAKMPGDLRSTRCAVRHPVQARTSFELCLYRLSTPTSCHSTRSQTSVATAILFLRNAFNCGVVVAVSRLPFSLKKRF